MKRLNTNFLENKTFNKADYNYKKSELSAGIIHIGVGNFHRAHQAYFFDALFNQRKDFNFGILGASLRQSDALIRNDLKEQNFLSTVVLRDRETTSVRVLQSMVDFLPADNLLLVDALSCENIKIVSLTITEGGYYIDSYGEFDILHSDIVKDINNSTNPKTIFGVLLLALAKRKEKNIAPFTLMSCDNIAHNGKVLKNIMLKMAEHINPTLINYISNEVSFPNSMVDRITPVTRESDKEFISKKYGYKDTRPVFCEPFVQWFLEDDFCNTRPALQDVGVVFVKDILPYELMKIRILNGSHACISSLAALLNITYVHEALENKIVKEFLDNVITHEIIPLLKDIVDVNLQEYYQTILTRFNNPYIKDTITRICIDNSSKIPKFIVQSIKDAIKKNSSVDGLALVCALWCRYCTGFDEYDNSLDIHDPKQEELKDCAIKAKLNPALFLSMQDIYGDLNQDENFVNIFSKTLNSLWENGVEFTVNNYNSNMLKNTKEQDK